MAVEITYAEFFKEELGQKALVGIANFGGGDSGGIYLMKTGDNAIGDYTFDGNTFVIDSENHRVGIGTSVPVKALTVNHYSGECLRLVYNDSDSDSTNYVDITVFLNGGLKINSSNATVDFSDNDLFTTGGIAVNNANATAGVVNVGTGFRIANAAASGAILRGNGTNFVSSGVAALTKTDDTNVTLTLGGTPTEALVTATSLTLGWSGQLSVVRGGTGIATTTPYSVICAGTTATGTFQSLAALGTAGYVLTSNGADVLPSFQAKSAELWIANGNDIYNTSYASGKVGIGHTVTPLGYLDVQSPTSTDVIAAFGSTAAVNAAYPGYIYISNVSTINSGYLVNGNASMLLNYAGYQNGVTQFRDLYIGNGKHDIITFFDGSTSNVGIGTESPREKLEVVGNITTDWNDRFIGTRYQAGTAFRMGIATVTDNRQVDLQALSGDGSFITITTGTVGAPVERVRILSGGNVGINTTSPGKKLEVVDSTGTQLLLSQINGTDSVGLMGYTDGTFYLQLGCTYDTTNAWLRTNGLTAGNQSFCQFNNNGSVYLGCKSASLASNTITWSSMIPLSINSAGNIGIHNEAGDALLHITAGTTSIPPLIIDSGYVTTNPIEGAIEFNVSTDRLCFTINNSDAPIRKTLAFTDEIVTYPGAGIPLSTGSAWGTSITNNSGNWNTAYTHSTNNSQAHTDYLINNGNDATSGSLTATNFILNPSDERLKTKIISIPIMPTNIEYKQFELKTESGKTRYGVIAQQVQLYHPELVTINKEGLLGINYIDLLMLEVAYLKNKVQELERRLN